MAAGIRVDKKKARSGINTLTFSDQGGFSFSPGVGIGTTVVNDPVTVANTGKLSVGVVSCRQLFMSGGANSNLKFGDSTAANINRLSLGISSDISIYHNGTNSFIDSNTGYIKIQSGGGAYVEATEFKIYDEAGSETVAEFISDGACILYQDTSARVTTTADGVDLGGTGGVGITKGTTGQRPGSPAAGDFRYNTTTSEFEGYTDEWGAIGGGGGVSQVSGIVSTTSTVGFAASFAIADARSASVNFLVTQGAGASAEWQTGKYLMIHDGTTVTVVEQAAVATNTMIATISGAISGANAELLVTMGAAGVATCSAKIDTMADSA